MTPCPGFCQLFPQHPLCCSPAALCSAGDRGGPLLPGSVLSGCSRACAGLRRPRLRGHLASGVRPGERAGLGESVLAWEFSGSSHHSARPHASADYPRTWSSGSESRRNNPPRSTQTCWGKSRRSQICKAGRATGWDAGSGLPPTGPGNSSTPRRAGTKPEGTPTSSHQSPEPTTTGQGAQASG